MRVLSRAALAAALLVGGASALAAHDLFIKLETFFVRPGAAIRAPVLNGTFSKSENSIARQRVADLSVVSPAGRASLDTGAVDASRDTTFLALRTDRPGTYVVGLSTRASGIALSGKEFTGYLKEEALTGIIADRQKAGTTADSVRERYSKHVKAVFQVGDVRSDGYAAALGYPAEIVPLENPYALRRSGTLRVRCLVDGKPAAGVAVLVGGRRPDGTRLKRLELTSDADGVAAVPLGSAGHWYVKFIHMTPVDEPETDYESKWATLTFEVR
jgi:hypothetical protein